MLPEEPVLESPHNARLKWTTMPLAKGIRSKCIRPSLPPQSSHPIQRASPRSHSMGNCKFLQPPPRVCLALHTWVIQEHRRHGRSRWEIPLSQRRSLWQPYRIGSCKTHCDCPPGRPWPWLPRARTWEQSWHWKPSDEVSVGSKRRQRWQVWEMWTTDCIRWWPPRPQHLKYAHSRWIHPRNFHPPQQIKSCQHVCTSALRSLRLYDHGLRT